MYHPFFKHSQCHKRWVAVRKLRKGVMWRLVVAAAAAAAVIAASGCRALPIVPLLVIQSDQRPNMLVADMRVGEPARHIRMEVRFDVSGIFLRTPQEVNSASFIRDVHGDTFDRMYFGASMELMTFAEGHPAPDALRYPIMCGACGGVLGLGPASPVWGKWTGALITPAAMTFGPLPARFAHSLRHGRAARCSESVVGGCVTASGVEIDVASPYMFLPHDTRKTYLHGLNVYDEEEWPTLNITLAHGIELAFSRDELINHHDSSESVELLLRDAPPDTRPLIGLQILRKAVVYLDIARGEIRIIEHLVLQHLPASYLIFFLLTTALVIRYKLVTTPGPFYSVYLLLGWIFAVVLLLMPETSGFLLPDDAFLYWSAVAIVGAATLVLPVTRMRRVPVYKLLEVTWYDAVLFTALWLSTVPRRREGVATGLTAFAGGFAVYTFTGHAIKAVAFVSAYKRPLSSFDGAAVASVIGLWIYFHYVFAAAFLLPLLERTTGLWNDYALVFTFVTVVVVTAAGAYIQVLYIQREVHRSVLAVSDAAHASA